MWKLKISKYKNAHPKMPKKDDWIGNLKAANFFPSYGNHIQASAAYLAFNTDAGGGGCLGVVPIHAHGRQPSTGVPLIHAHAEYVTDFAFSPFDDYLLATCSQDGHLKSLRIPETLDGVEHLTDILSSVPVGEHKVEVLQWHPAASQIIAASAGDTVKVYDIERSTHLYSQDNHDDVVQSIDWHPGRGYLLTTSKDQNLRVLDPRATSLVQCTRGHEGNREIRASWLGDTDYVLSTGCDAMRMREVIVRDIRNFSANLCFQQLDASNGTLMQFYDADRGMMVLAGKGDSKIWYFEFNGDNKTLNLNSTDPVEQIKGACCAPLRAADVMSCNVMPMFILIKNAIVPIPICVPRKSYSEFHSDLFPDVPCGIPAMTAEEWISGANKTVGKMSLDPRKHPEIIRRGDMPPGSVVGECLPSGSIPVDTVQQNQAPSQPSAAAASQPSTAPDSHSAAVSNNHSSLGKNNNGNQGDTGLDPSLLAERSHLKHVEKIEKPEPQEPKVMMRPKKTVNVLAGVRQSKFRHLKGTILHQSQHIENVKNVNKGIPGESDMFKTNSTFCAVPIAGPGGLLAVFNVNSPCRLPDSGVPVIQNGSALMDFAFDPFDDHKIVTACDDGKIKIWTIPANGLTENLLEPTAILKGHMERVYFIKFHPLARDILASASYDMTVRIWNLSTGEECIQLKGHTDTVFSLAWNPDGRYCCTVSKDGRIRLYNPRLSDQPLQEGAGPQGTRGARVIWVCNGRYILVSGMDYGSTRQLLLYDPAGLAQPVTIEKLDNQPALLIPYYDEDSSTLFLTSRGDSVVLAYEMADEPPFFFPLSSYNSGSLHQALAFFPKKDVDVKSVEFAKALRLTMNKIEPVSFTVPRIKTEYFQDDIYPETQITWEPTMSSEQWLAGLNEQQQTISLRPENMELLSNAPVEERTTKYESFESYQKTYKTDEEKREELLSAMNDKLDIKDEPLPQDLCEGVDEEEWDD